MTPSTSHFVGAALASVFLIANFFASPGAWADEDDPPLSQAPAEGETTSHLVEFSSPITFGAAVTEASSYSGTVLAIRYDNPEMTGEYSFQSGITPTAFESDFVAQTGTSPAATGLVIETTVPSESQSLARREPVALEEIEVAGPAFVPPPATFSAEVEAMRQVPTALEESQSVGVVAPMASTADWRPIQGEFEILNYQANRVTFISSYWWLDSARPTLLPSGFGIEFEVNMYGDSGNAGLRPSCFFTSNGLRDYAYKTRLAAQNQSWNWRVIRPDGETAPSSLGAYADYNDLGDSCTKSSFAIGLRYPRNIQFVNGGYGILIVIDAPKGDDSTSKISAVNQVVSDGFCNVWPYSLGSKTDCMGVIAGDWPSGVGPKAQTMLNEMRDWSAPKRCWLTDFYVRTAGDVYDNTAWC